MITILILSMCNVVLLMCLVKWGFIERYEIYKPTWLPTWCEMCFYFTCCSMPEFIFLNLHMILNFHLAFYVWSNAMACTFLSLVFSKIYQRI